MHHHRLLVIILAFLVSSAWRAELGVAQAPDPTASGFAVSRAFHHIDVVWIPANGAMQWTTWNEQTGWGKKDPAKGEAAALLPPGRVLPAGITLTTGAYSRLDVFSVRPGGAIGQTFWRSEHTGTPAQKWRDRQHAPAGSAAPNTGITSVWRNAGWLDVFWIGTNGAIQQSSWMAIGAWQPTVSITPAGAANPASRLAAVVPLGYPDHMALFWVQPNGAVGTTRWDRKEGWRSPSQIAPAGAADPRGGIVALSRATDLLDLFWISPDGAVATRAAKNDAWDVKQVVTAAPSGSASPSSGLAAIAPTPHRLDVFWVDPSGAIAANVFTEDPATGAGSWGHSDTITGPATAPLDSPVAAVARTPWDRDVFWVRDDGKLGSVKLDSPARTWQAPVAIAGA